MTRLTVMAGLPALLVATIYGCAAPASSLQTTDDLLNQARLSVQRAEADEAIRHAPDEFLAAKAALEEATQEGSRDAAYRAWHQAEIASAKTRGAASTQQIERVKSETARLEAETRRYQAEAEAARQQRGKERAEAATAQALARAETETAAKERALREKAAAELRAVVESAEKERALKLKEELESRLRSAATEIAQVREEQRGLIISLSDILFDSGKATILPGMQHKLTKLAKILSTYPDRRIVVEGHTDNTGGNDFNLQLSEARAESVRNMLITEQINPEMITAAGFGKSKPVASNATPEGRQQNRRVEIVVLNPPDAPAPTSGP